MPAQRAFEVQTMKLRSILFVPGDRPERFAKAAASGADAIILDLEDSVTLPAKDKARAAVAEYLSGTRTVPIAVRINPLGSGLTEHDLAAALPGAPDMIVLPKAEGAASVRTLLDLMGTRRCPVLPIATETPAAIFQLGSYAEVAEHLVGLSWGAEDLPAAIGASSAREENGRYTPPYEIARSLTLFAAHAANVAALDTVFPHIADAEGLAAYVARARRDGFTGMLAIHPAQVETINAGFTPSEAEIDHARAVIAAFKAQPLAGALMLDGKMIDRPHLIQAERLLSRL